MTREDAVAKLVELDVERWGELERAASRRRRGALSHGLALNALAHYDPNAIDEEMAAEAAAIMTLEDHRALRQGG